MAIPISICLYTFYKHVYLRSKSSYSFYSILNYEDKALIKEIFKSLIAGILINLNDSRFGTRMKGEGEFSKQIAQQFAIAKKKYLKNITRKKEKNYLF